ncbi:MAG: FHA domain-containing protein [Gracilibacteraceae bacterium]|jgi:hypothetical protein|nr:FHA domain-containing protein [Gracilibacteraceae bacterium]
MNLKKLMIFCLLTVFLSQSAYAAMGAPAEIHIEQVSVTLPEINVYLRAGEALDMSRAVAFLGGEPLTVEGARLFDPGEGVFYIFLVDVSGSILERQTQAIKEALRSFAAAKGKNDRIALIAFGDKTDIFLDGTETDAGVIRAGIDLLHRNAPLTYFYEAINYTVDFSAVRGADYPNRRIAVVISDGGDDTAGGRVTREEAAARLTGGNLPFYGFGLQRRDVKNQLLNKEDLDDFGELVRLSQGKVSGTVFDNDAESGNIGEKLMSFRDYIEDFSVLSLKGASNIASGRTETLSIQLGDGEPIEIPVRPDQAKAIKDTAAPGIISVEQISTPKNTVRVRFSESLRGAGDSDLAAAIKEYVTVTDRTGDVMALPAVVYSAGAEEEYPYCDMTFDVGMYSGAYSVSFRGLTDQSFEKNPLTEAAQPFTYGGRPAYLRPFDQLGRFWWLFLILAIFAALGISYFILRNRKDRIMAEDKPGFGDMAQPRSAALLITDAWGGAKRVHIEISQGFFVGRDGNNNMCFDDEHMSRQHFIIEAEGDGFYLTDLESTNGTLLNGVQIIGRRQLQPNDMIQAGQEKFVFLGGW